MHDLTAGLSAPDLLRFASGLRSLLALQTDLYTSYDSTSLSSETAGELLESVSFVIRARLRELGRPLLPDDDAEKLFREGLQTLDALLLRCKNLYARALLLKGETSTVALDSSLNSIGKFFTIYDSRFFAHMLPCEIDYRPCIPVSEEEAGAEYIEKYLRHIICELGFLRRFSFARRHALLHAWQPGYMVMVTDIFDPVLANALGRIILRCDPRPLCLDRADIQNIGRLCDGKDIFKIISKAAEELVLLFESSNDEADYILKASAGIALRMKSASDHSRIFTAFQAG